MSKQKFAFITVLLTYLLIVFGGYVASSESGMGRALCNSQLIPGLQDGSNRCFLSSSINYHHNSFTYSYDIYGNFNLVLAK